MIELRWLEYEVLSADESTTRTERVLQVRHVEWYLPGSGRTSETDGTVSIVPFEGFLQRWSDWQDVPVVTG